MSGYRPPRHSALGGVQIKGRGAWVLAKLLENARAIESIRRMPVEAGQGEAMEAYEALRAAAIYWAAERDDKRGSQQPAAEITQPVLPGQTAQASKSDDISAADAAALIGCTERRVRQLLAAERLEGRLIAGRWLVDSSSVEGYVLAKEAC